MKRTTRFIIPAFFMALFLLVPVLAWSQDEAVTLNFRDTDIRTVVKAVSDFTGKTFIIDPKVKGKIHIVSSRPIRSEAVYGIFLTAMRLSGYSVVESDGVARIMTLAEVSTEATGIIFPDGDIGPVESDTVATRIFPLAYESAPQMIQVLRPLIGAKNAMVAHQQSNSLIIVDTVENLNRVARIIDSVDRPNLGKTRLIKFTHIGAHDFIDLFEQVYADFGKTSPQAGAAQAASGQGGRSLRYVMTPTGAGNSLILRTDDPVVEETVLALAEQVDTKDEGSQDIRVVRLAHSDPAKVVQALNGLSSGKAPAKGASPSAQQGAKSSGGIAIADEANKSIIISAPSVVYRQWRDVIDKMDRRPGQIYVEGLVAEVTSEKMAEFGMQWQSMRGVDSTRRPRVIGIGGTNLGGNVAGTAAGIADGNVNLGAGIGLGLISGTLTLPNGMVIPNMLALARALETDANANILSTPTLLALDGEEAKMLVGQNVPLVTGSYAPNTGGSAGSVTPFQTIERKDIGLTLRIKPRISDGSTVRLDIYQEVSSLLPVTVQTGAADVVTNKRSLETRVLVEDGQIIALGGLMQEKLSVNEDKVPFLGDIPLLGALFRYEKRIKSKTNLMVFIRPRVIRDAQDSAPTTTKIYGRTLEEQGDIKVWPYTPLPGMSSPRSPELELKEKNGTTTPGNIGETAPEENVMTAPDDQAVLSGEGER